MKFGIPTFAFISLLAFSSLSNANYSADLFELGSNKQKKLFELKVTEAPSPTGGELFTAVYSDLAGASVFEEKTEFSNGKIQKVVIEQKQLGQSALIEVKNGEVHFSLTKGGSTSIVKERLEEPFVTSGGMTRFIKANWQDLVNGKAVKLRYGVWYRQDTVGFEFKKVSESGEGASKRVVLKYKPTSFLIAALVDPLEFVINGDGTRILELRGRVAPKIKKGDDFKDLDAEMIYKY